MSDEEIRKSLKVIADEFRKLKAAGWREPHPSSDCDHELLILEAGSTGIHDGYCDDEENYWIDDDEVSSTYPLLVKRLKRTGDA